MRSQYGERDTVGSIYIEAQKNSTENLTLRDIGEEMVNGLIEDINKTVSSLPYGEHPFYINVVEERDLQMKNAFKRRLFTSLGRPFPEDNTLVFYIVPNINQVYICWDLPHHSEIANIMSDFTNYDALYIKRINEFQLNDLSNFGFLKVPLDDTQIQGYSYKEINLYKQAYIDFITSKGADGKSIDLEKKEGFFWMPNKLHVESKSVVR